MFNKILSFLLALLMGLLQSLGIAVNTEDFMPSMEVIGQYAYGDKNPEIEVSVKKTSFRFILPEDSVALSGAFRELHIDSVKRKSGHTLIIKTNGKITDGYAMGYVLVSDKAVRAKTALQAEAEIDMSFIDPGIAGGGIEEQAKELAKKQAKALITAGIKKIPYVGGIASSLLDSKINEILGIKPSPSIKDVLNELEIIKNQLNNISFQIDQTRDDILRSLYAESNFKSINEKITSLKGDVVDTYNQIYNIGDLVPQGTTDEEKLLYEYVRSVRIASLLDFNSKNPSKMVTTAREVSTYAAGEQVSVDYEESLFVKAFEYACSKDAVLGGEAALIVGPYINEVSDILANAYKAMAVVLASQLYVCEHYDDIIAKSADSGELANALKGLSTPENYDLKNNAIYYRYLTQLASNDKEDGDVSLMVRYSNLLSEENSDSVVTKYNRMVDKRWFSFIQRTDISDGSIDVTFVDLSGTIGSVTPTELGVDTSKISSGTASMVENVNNNLKARIFKLTSEETKKIVEHMLSNGNNVFVEKEEGDGLQPERNIQKIFEDYGFIFPKADEGKVIFTSDSKKSYKDTLISPQVPQTDYSASLTVTGYNCGGTVNYSTALERTSDIKWEDTKYYSHSSSSVRGSLTNIRTSVEKCTFCYFAPAPIELKTPEAFADFITSVAKGQTYAGETVLLTTNVDLSKDKYENMWPADLYANSFRGTFDGGMHIITGLTDSTAYPGSGLFRTLGEGARVSNLILDSVSLESKGEKSGCGTVAGRVTGNAVINSVMVKGGSVKGHNMVGGLVGEVTGGSLVIKDCDNNAEVCATGNYAGGIVGGSTSKKSQSMTICTNTANVTANNASAAGGIVGYLANDSADPAHHVTHCTNEGDISSNGGRTGGVIGHLDSDSNSHMISNNRNTGDIKAPEGYAGGIVAYSEGGGNFTKNTNEGAITSGKDGAGIVAYNEDDSIDFSNCVNEGNVTSSADGAGIAGYLGNNSNDRSYTAKGCRNSGMITAKTSAGGIFGHLDTDGTKQVISGNENSGDITSTTYFAAGIVAYSEGGGDFTNNTNTGNIRSGKDGGGIVGYNEDDSITFSGSKNFGNVTAAADAGGIAGFAGSKDNDKAYTFVGCTNTGVIYSETTNAGGIAGVIKSDNKNHNFTDCTNEGKVTGKTTSGGIIGYMFGGGQITGCTNKGDITATDAYAGGMVGRIEDDKVTFTDNTPDGSVTAPKYCGKTCGYDGNRKTTY